LKLLSTAAFFLWGFIACWRQHGVWLLLFCRNFWFTIFNVKHSKFLLFRH